MTRDSAVAVIKILNDKMQSYYDEQRQLLEGSKQLFSKEQALKDLALRRKVVHELILQNDASAPKIDVKQSAESFRLLRQWLERVGLYFNLFVDEIENIELPYHFSGYAFRVEKRYSVPAWAIDVPGFELSLPATTTLQVLDVTAIFNTFKRYLAFHQSKGADISLGTVIRTASRENVAVCFQDQIQLCAAHNRIDVEVYKGEVLYNELGHLLFEYVVPTGDAFGTFNNSIPVTRLAFSEAFSDFTSLANSKSPLLTLKRLHGSSPNFGQYAFSQFICNEAVQQFVATAPAPLNSTSTLADVIKCMQHDKAIADEMRKVALQVYCKHLTQRRTLMTKTTH